MNAFRAWLLGADKALMIRLDRPDGSWQVQKFYLDALLSGESPKTFMGRDGSMVTIFLAERDAFLVDAPPQEVTPDGKT
jgi:hypothetical protein